MKKVYLLFLITSISFSSLSQALLTTGLPPVNWDKNKFYFLRNIYPHHATPSWGDFWWAANGIAHNKDFIFICAVKRTVFGTTDKVDYIIWKIPITYDLNQDFRNDPTVKRFQLTNMDTINSPTRKKFMKYTHIGDIDVCTIDGKEYIIAPLTGGGTPIIGFFRTSDLSFVNYHKLFAIQPDVGWCAFSKKDKRIYTSNDLNQYFISYKIDKTKINSSHHDALVFKVTTNGAIITSIIEPKIHAIDKPIPNMQGGCFTDDSKLLYVSSGVPDAEDPTDGITVFETKNWKVINHSINLNRNPHAKGCFQLNFDAYDGFLNYWVPEPEGLDIFDADDGRTPHVKGQLHVILDDHNATKSSNVSLWNYGIFKAPKDITVEPTSAQGTTRSNPVISAILDQCSDVKNNAPANFPCGSTTIKFTYKKTFPETILGYTKVTVKNKRDSCTNALRLYSCDNEVTDNYCAASGVWFYIDPPTSAFSIETTQVPGGLSNTVMQVYSGNCGNLQEIANDDNSGDNDHAKITFDPSPGPGRLYIKVTDYGTNNFGRFGIRVKRIAPGQPLFVNSSYVAGDKAYVHKNPVVPIDVNGDKMTDLVFIGQKSSGSGLSIITKMSNGDGTYHGYSCLYNDKSIINNYPLLTGDIDNDGKMDIIFFAKGKKSKDLVIKVKRSNGNGTFTSYAQTFKNEFINLKYPPKTGDFDADGKTDIIFFGFNWNGPGLNVRIKFSNGDGTFRSVTQVLGDMPEVLQYPVIVADMTGDRRSDLVFVGQNWNGSGLNIRTKISTADGSFVSTETRHGDGPGVHKYPVLVGDVDADGKADLVFIGYNWSGYGLNMRTKFSNGDGTYRKFSQVTGDGISVFDYPALSGDVDGDGKMDIIFNGQNWGGCGLNIRVKFSKGNGTWCSRWQTLGDGDGVHTYPVLPGTFNLDNKTDLVFVGQDWEGTGLNIRTKFSVAGGCTTGRIAENDSVPGEDTLINNEPFITLDPLMKENITSTLQESKGTYKDEPVLTTYGSEKKYSVFPNPTNGILTIKSTITKPVSICILNGNGNVVRRIEKIYSGQKVDISSLTAGFYFLEIGDQFSGDREVMKIIKIN